MQEHERIPSPYKRGADSGFIFGIYLSAIFLTTFYGFEHQASGLISTLLMCGVPVYAFFALRRSYIADGCRSLLSALWMEGITMFFCGSLISGLVSFVCMRYVDPGWLTRVFTMAAEAAEAMPGDEGAEMAEMFRAVIENHAIPPAIAISFQTIWLAVLTGSLLSLIISAILKATMRPKPKA